MYTLIYIGIYEDIQYINFDTLCEIKAYIEGKGIYGYIILKNAELIESK